jgi:hypothetical protein
VVRLRLIPPKPYWLWLVPGIILVVIINLAIPVAFLATTSVSLLFALIPISGPWGFVRKFSVYAFSLAGVELVITGSVILLGYGLVAAFSDAAASMAAFFMLTVGPTLGIFFIVIGAALAFIGSLIAA